MAYFEPYVSVCTITYNEEKNIEQCLCSIIQQRYFRDRFEILVVDSGSTDSTVRIVQEMAKKDERIRIFHSGKRSISFNRNMGLAKARGELIAFIDADCIAPENWLEVLVSGYQKYKKTVPNLVAVGGFNIPPEKANRFQRVLGVFFNTYFGTHGSPQGRIFKIDQPVRHLPTLNVLYEKSKVLEVSGFDLHMHNIIEDEDLSIRLTKRGYQLIYLKDSYVYHRFRDNYYDFLKRMFIYGKGRAWFMRKHFKDSPKILIAPAILSLGLILTALGTVHKLFLLPLLYFPFIFIVSVYESLRAGKFFYVIELFLIYMIAHICYGFGEIYGMFAKAKVNYL